MISTMSRIRLQDDSRKPVPGTGGRTDHEGCAWSRMDGVRHEGRMIRLASWLGSIPKVTDRNRPRQRRRPLWVTEITPVGFHSACESRCALVAVPKGSAFRRGHQNRRRKRNGDERGDEEQCHPDRRKFGFPSCKRGRASWSARPADRAATRFGRSSKYCIKKKPIPRLPERNRVMFEDVNEAKPLPAFRQQNESWHKSGSTEQAWPLRRKEGGRGSPEWQAVDSRRCDQGGQIRRDGADGKHQAPIPAQQFALSLSR